MKKNNGFVPLFLIALVAVLFLLVAILFGTNSKKQLPVQSQETDNVKLQLKTLSDSDELGTIESELNGTNIDSIDNDLNSSLSQVGL